MIIKGGSRAAPSQLAWHLQRRDTNEKIQILELQSAAPNLKEAFRDWQILTEGTRGVKGLYHANIDPAKDYVMTPEQWQRAVDVLEKELKLEGQPRAVVMHEKHGRSHIHVVWARTDIDRMILRSDSQNYLAHERASQRLELEFGHEQVPGKHAKRDREKQPEFPRAEANQAEWQQGERTGLKPAARKEQVTALKQASDNAQAFKTALEEQGYVLAQGDRRDFVIVDETGSIHSLGRQIQGVKAAELRAFMKDLDRAALPTAAEAVEQQRQRTKELRQDQLLQEKAEPKEEEAKPEQQEAKPEEPRRDAPQPTQPQPSTAPPETAPDALQAQTEALTKAVAERQAEERQQLIAKQTAELEQLRETINHDTQQRLARFDARQKQETDALSRRQKEARSGFTGFVESVRNFLSPARAAEQEAERQREQEQLTLRQKQERDDYTARLDQANKLELENVTELNALRLQQQTTKGEEELERYLREQEVAQRLQAEFEERERQRAEEESRDQQPGDEYVRDGPERPPKFTK